MIDRCQLTLVISQHAVDSDTNNGISVISKAARGEEISLRRGLGENFYGDEPRMSIYHRYP